MFGHCDRQLLITTSHAHFNPSQDSGGLLNSTFPARNTWIWIFPAAGGAWKPLIPRTNTGQNTLVLLVFRKLVNVNTARREAASCSSSGLSGQTRNRRNHEGAAAVGSSSAALAPSLTHTHPHHPHPPSHTRGTAVAAAVPHPPAAWKNPAILWKSWGGAEQLLGVSSSSLAQFQTCELTWVHVPLLRWALHRLQRAQTSCPLPASAVPRCLRPPNTTWAVSHRQENEGEGSQLTPS